MTKLFTAADVNKAVLLLDRHAEVRKQWAIKNSLMCRAAEQDGGCKGMEVTLSNYLYMRIDEDSMPDFDEVLELSFRRRLDLIEAELIALGVAPPEGE
jgi:hypothetical protein